MIPPVNCLILISDLKFFDQINSAAWVSIFYCLIVFINLFGVKGYGEAEFLFSLIKVTAVIGFIFLGVILDCGGGPVGGYIGGKYFHDRTATKSIIIVTILLI